MASIIGRNITIVWRRFNILRRHERAVGAVAELFGLLGGFFNDAGEAGDAGDGLGGDGPMTGSLMRALFWWSPMGGHDARQSMPTGDR